MATKPSMIAVSFDTAEEAHRAEKRVLERFFNGLPCHIRKDDTTLCISVSAVQKRTGMDEEYIKNFLASLEGSKPSVLA